MSLRMLRASSPPPRRRENSVSIVKKTLSMAEGRLLSDQQRAPVPLWPYQRNVGETSFLKFPGQEFRPGEFRNLRVGPLRPDIALEPALPRDAGDDSQALGDLLVAEVIDAAQGRGQVEVVRGELLRAEE